VLARANAVLTELEKAEDRPKPTDLAGDLPLFSAAKATHAQEIPPKLPLEAAVEVLRPDAMTPREALDALYRLKALLDRATEP
jgi:DNA mismatch repair protein MutS